MVCLYLTRCVLVWMLLLMTILAAITATQHTVRGHRAALLIIDVQDCFLSGGGLPVPDGEQVVPVINKLRVDHEDQLSLVVVTQDWHCVDHVSFASQHPGHALFSQVNLTYNADGALCYGESVPREFPHAVDCSNEATEDQFVVPQTLWPDHCIMDVTSGPTSAKLFHSLTVKSSDTIVKKGYSCGVDSYSAFYDNGGFHQTALDGILKQNGIELVVVTGLALDYCVYYTAKDAHFLGYKVLTVTDASRGVAPDSTAAALKHMKELGIELVQAEDLEGALQDANKTGDPYRLSVILIAVGGALLAIFAALKIRP